MDEDDDWGAAAPTKPSSPEKEKHPKKEEEPAAPAHAEAKKSLKKVKVQPKTEPEPSPVPPKAPEPPKAPKKEGVNAQSAKESKATRVTDETARQQTLQENADDTPIYDGLEDQMTKTKRARLIQDFQRRVASLH
jgi:outer membrane biosynthesis protein TonB